MTAPAAGALELRVLTYNVHALRRGARPTTDAVARVIAAAAPDLVCIQEAPTLLRWRTRGAELARRSGLYVVAGGRPAAGNLLLAAARVDVVAAETLVLTRTPGLPRRGCVAARVRVGGIELGVIGTHLGLRSGERERHAAELIVVADRLRASGATAVVVAGDLNSELHRPEWRALRTRFRDAAGDRAAAATYPAPAPRSRIDVVLADAAVEVVSVAVPEHVETATASDHRPVLAVLELAAG